MSNRAIAPTVGVSEPTARRDAQQVRHSDAPKPERIDHETGEVLDPEPLTDWRLRTLKDAEATGAVIKLTGPNSVAEPGLVPATHVGSCEPPRVGIELRPPVALYTRGSCTASNLDAVCAGAAPAERGSCPKLSEKSPIRAWHGPERCAMQGSSSITLPDWQPKSDGRTQTTNPVDSRLWGLNEVGATTMRYHLAVFPI